MQINTASSRLIFATLHTVEASEVLKGHVVSQRLHSNATYEYSYLVGARNARLGSRGCELYAHVHIAIFSTRTPYTCTLL